MNQTDRFSLRNLLPLLPNLFATLCLKRASQNSKLPADAGHPRGGGRRESFPGDLLVPSLAPQTSTTGDPRHQPGGFIGFLKPARAIHFPMASSTRLGLLLACWIGPVGLTGAAQPTLDDPFHAPAASTRGAHASAPPNLSAEMAAEPLQLSTIPLHHAEAQSVAELLKESGLLSVNGSISTDKRTNTLVLRDLPATIQATQELIAQLDKQNQQVMVEARIVLASGDYTLELGNRLGLERRSSSSHLIGGTNNLLSGSAGSNIDSLLIDLPSVSSGGQIGFAVGKIGSSLLQFELAAMEAEGHGQIVSSPRVLTTERRQARIEQGVQIPYQQNSESGATTVAFRNAALSLTVTPTISQDGSVLLELEVTKDAVGEVFAGVPSIDTQAVTTHLRVRDGETVILGGVQEQEQHEQRQWIPWLAKIPLLGRLFRQHRERSRHQELLVFVTPKVLDSPAALGTQGYPQDYGIKSPNSYD